MDMNSFIAIGFEDTAIISVLNIKHLCYLFQMKLFVCAMFF